MKRIIPLLALALAIPAHAALVLRQATASQSVTIGPFVDSTDGVTLESGLTIANTDIRLSANGGNYAAKNSGGGTYDESGMYTITLDATDTATVGKLQLVVAVSGALVVYHEYQVVEEAVYDATVAANADPGTAQTGDVYAALPTNFADLSITASTGRVDVAAVGGTTQTANDNGADINAILVDTGTTLDGRIPAALAGGLMQTDVQAINGVTITGDGSGTPFAVSYEQQQNVLSACFEGWSKRKVRKAIKQAQKLGFSYESCHPTSL